MAALDDASDARAALEARHAREWTDFEEEAAAARDGASKKKLKEINFALARREDELRFRQGEELDDLDGDAATVEEEDDDDAAERERLRREAEEKAAIERKKAKAAKKRGKKAQKDEEKRTKAAAIDAETAELEKNSRRKAECAAIDAKLAPLGLRTRDVAADGHCLYRAVADQCGRDFADLRKTCADYMAGHADDFLAFVALDAADPAAFFDAYCERVRASADWGGQPELLALARALRRRIRVYARDAPVVEMGEGEDLVVTYHRDYYALGEHYNSTERLPA